MGDYFALESILRAYAWSKLCSGESLAVYIFKNIDNSGKAHDQVSRYRCDSEISTEYCL